MPLHHHCQRRTPLLPCCLSSLILMQLLLVQQAFGIFLPTVASSNIPNILKEEGVDNGETTPTPRSSSSRFLRHRAATNFFHDMDANTKRHTRQLPSIARSQGDIQKDNANSNNVQNMTKVSNDQNTMTNNNNAKGQKAKAAKGVWMEDEKTHKMENNRPTSTEPSPAPSPFSEEIGDEDEDVVSQEVETTEPTGGAEDESFARDKDDEEEEEEEEEESITSPEEVERRPEPTNSESEYPSEESKLTSPKANTDDFEDEEEATEEAAKVEEYEKEEEKLEKELSMEKREVRRIGGFSFLLAVIAMVVTAQQMSENPDGIYASFCRLIITLFGCAFKMALVPVRSFVGGSRPYGHMPVSTMDYNYRDPYRPGADSMELS